MELKDGKPTYYAKTRKQWRAWLQKNHASAKSVWLVIYHKECGMPSVYYPEALAEALCFGWIDSKAIKKDEHSRYQYFAKRNPKSNWSKINKAKVDQLLSAGLMEPAGMEMVQLAKENGNWDALNEVDEVMVPADLQQAFDNNTTAFENWCKFSRSSRRGILEWILNAKRPGTRQKRIDETVKLASQNIKANHPG